MQLAAVAAGAFVAGGDLFVDGGEQGAGAAGEVSDSQLADGLGIRPVDPFQLGDREPGQQRGGGRQGVEGGQVFAVGDEPLEDAAGEVVGIFDAGCVDALGCIPQSPQYSGRVGGVQMPKNILGDGEYGASN